MSMDVSRVRAHRRQFVLWRERVTANPDWCAADLGAAGILSHCPDLSVTHVSDRDGARWTLLGTALSVDPAHETPSAMLAACPTAAVATGIESFAGRWLVIGPDRIYTDATAQLGCLFGRDDAGQLVVTSSPGLGASIGLSAPRPVSDARRLVHGRGMTWFPPPRTRFAGLQRLLPSQYLDLHAGVGRPRRLLPPVAGTDTDTLIDEILALLSRALGRLPTVSDRLHLGLSAGADSRTILAVGAAAGVPLRTFTRLTARISAADRLMPPQLAARAGLPHAYVREAPVAQDRREMFRAHTAGTVATAQAGAFLAGVRDSLDGVMTNGGGFALVSGYANWRTLHRDLPEPAEGARAICALLGEPAESHAVPGLQEWLAWVHTHPAPELDWRDRLFLEQRRAGWQAAKEQVYDMQDLVRLPVLNCARIAAGMLALPEAVRRGQGIQKRLIARSLPALLEPPFNPPDSAFLGRRPDIPVRRAFWHAGQWLARLA